MKTSNWDASTKIAGRDVSKNDDLLITGGLLRRRRQRTRAVRTSTRRAALTQVITFGAILCGVVVAAPACVHSSSAVRTKTESASTVTADSLIVSLADVRRIADIDDLTSNPRGDKRQPYHLNSEPPGPCRIFDPQVAFGSDWTQFRSIVYNGVGHQSVPDLPAPTPSDHAEAGAPAPPKPLMVIQVVGIYPDENAARSVFKRIVPALSACSALHAKYYDFTVDQTDASTVVLNYGGESKDIYHVKSSVLVQVSAAGFSETLGVADRIFRDIIDRIV